MKTRKFVLLSLLTALGLAVGFFESFIPLPVMIPGARLGLANIVVLVTIVSFGYKEGLIVAMLKSVLLVLVTGSVSSFIFSFTGTLLSSLGMILAHKFLSKQLSLIGISEIGSFLHNLGQVFAAMFVLKNPMIISYFPFLAGLGLFTGYFVGISANFISNNLKTVLKGQR